MPNSQGWFFVLEGSDGSGKATQLNLLKARLEAAGYEVELFDFPRYSEDSSYFVKQYLDGNYGPSGEVSPYTASLFYALDRFEAAPGIRQALSDGKIVLSNRYVGSNMAHQGAKFGSEAEQRGFFLWADSLEFQLMGIPRPSLNLFLRLPTRISQNLLKQRARKDNRKLDGHESDTEHLKSALQTYDLLSKLFPKDFMAIECAPNDNLQSVADISDSVWDIVKPLLPPPTRPGQPTVINLDKPAGLQSKEPPKSSAVLIETESTENFRTEISLKLEDISLLAISELRTLTGINIDLQLTWTKSAKAPGFYEPSATNRELKKRYAKFMADLAGSYTEIEKGLHDFVQSSGKNISARAFAGALAPLVPMAAYANARMRTNTAGVEQAASKLLQSEVAVSRNLVEQIRSAIEPNGTRAGSSTDKTKPDASISSLIKQFYGKHSPATLPAEAEEWEILDFDPKNEFDLVADSIYSHTDSSLADIKSVLDSWTYEQKLEALKLAASQPDSFALKNTKYRFDVIADQIFFQELNGLGVVTNLEIQAISPRFGYQTPKLIEEAGLEERYLECFDKSLEMYSGLQAAGMQAEAAYACLQGHKSRAQFSLNAQSIRNALAGNTLDPVQASIIRKIILKVIENHPIIGGYMAELMKTRPTETQKSPAKRLSPPKPVGSHAISKLNKPNARRRKG